MRALVARDWRAGALREGSGVAFGAGVGIGTAIARLVVGGAAMVANV